MLYKFVVSAFESTVGIKLYLDFYAHLEREIQRKWYRDQESQSKAQGLFSSCARCDFLVYFALLFNGLEPLKPLVTKLRKRNWDIYHAYHMAHQVISDLKDTKRDIENEFKAWFKFATDVAASVDVNLKSLKRQSVGIVSGIMFLVLTVRVTTVDQLLFL